MRKKGKKKYSGFGGAGIRLNEREDPRMRPSHSSEYEVKSLYAYHMFDKAHLLMMAEEKVIPQKDVFRMLSALRAMETRGVEKVRLAVGYGMHSGEKYLIRELGEEVGGKIHLGRSSGDLSQVGYRIRIRDELLLVMQGMNILQESFLNVATRHVNTVMPGYTHGQHAQPTTFAHYLVSYASTLARDLERLEAAYHRINKSPAGAAILTGSNFPVNRHRVADLLGFETPLRNTNDAIWANDSTIEVFLSLALFYHNMARWATDFQLWCSNEFSMIDIPDRFCVTSSIMMQKKNPWIFENIKGSAAHTIGSLMTMFLACKGATGLPRGDVRYAMDALWTALSYIIRDVYLLAELLPEMRVNQELMEERAGAFWAQATDVGGLLVKEKGLPWRTAHQIVGILVRLSYERGRKPRDIDTGLLDEASMKYMGKPVELSKKSLKKALDPVEFIKGRTLFGGTAPHEVLAQVAELRRALDRNKKIVIQMSLSLKKASQKLERNIDAFLRKNRRK